MNSIIAVFKKQLKLINFVSFMSSEHSVANKNPDINTGLARRVIASRHIIRPVLSMFKLHSLTRVNSPIDLTAFDVANAKYRFNVTYHLLSVNTNTRYIFTTFAAETSPLLSVQSLYPAFNWSERELWDMYGIFFIKHPDLRRILSDYGFSGFPLRKDFPLSGFRELQFSEFVKQVEYTNIELTQAYRLLSFSNTWSN